MENNGETLMLLNSREGENKNLATIIQLSTASILMEWEADSAVSSKIYLAEEQEADLKEEQLTENQLHKKEKLNLV